MMMASPAVFTSCGNDDPMEEVENPETKLDVWTEPFHIMGANVDEVKSYMSQSMKVSDFHFNVNYSLVY